MYSRCFKNLKPGDEFDFSGSTLIFNGWVEQHLQPEFMHFKYSTELNKELKSVGLIYQESMHLISKIRKKSKNGIQ